ncbi:MAG: AI-2E family transporter [Myxococcota bacterium]
MGTHEPADLITEDLTETDAEFNGTHSPGAIAFFTVVFIAALAVFFWLFMPYATDFILAFMFVALFRAPYEQLKVRLNGNAMAASALITTVIAFAVAIPLGFIITSLSVEAAAFYNNTLSTLTVERIQGFLFGDGPQAMLIRKLAETAGVEWTPQLVRDGITSASGTVANILYTFVTGQLSNVFALILHFFIMLMVIYFMLIDGQELKQYVFETSPLPDDEEELLAQKFAAVGRATLFGNGFGSAIQGVIGAISMVVVGLPSPVLWGFVMTIFAFLPLVGVSIVTVPAAIYLAITGKWVAALLFFSFNFVQALIVENVVKTRLIGSQMRMHSLLIFMSIMGGLSLFGIIGLLYGPLIVALFLTLAELYHQRYKPHILVVRSSNVAVIGKSEPVETDPVVAVEASGPDESAEEAQEEAGSQ